MKFYLIEQISSKQYINRDQMGGLGINKMPDSSPILKLFSNIKQNMIYHYWLFYSIFKYIKCLFIYSWNILLNIISKSKIDN